MNPTEKEVALMHTAIEVSALTKSYGSHPVLRELTFAVRQGEIFALLGTNGAGKTTALECIEGLRRPDSGEIRVSGKMGIQLQSATLPACIKPLEAAELFARWHRTRPDRDLLDGLGIGTFSAKLYGQLSTGQKRRLHLALALTGDPDIVFLDEPTAGLDVEGRIALHSQIRRLKAQGKTILLASHDMTEVKALCDRIAILSGGSAAFVGTTEELAEKAGKSFTICIKSEQGEEILRTDDIGAALLLSLEDYRKKAIRITDIQIDRGSLEEDFIRLTKEEKTCAPSSTQQRCSGGSTSAAKRS